MTGCTFERMAALSEFGIRLSAMSPSYLHTNSTSHTGPFSALAELVDNACDPGVTAKQLWIDVTEIKNTLCLMFMDSGSGMTPNRLQKMLSFGFTEKAVVKNHLPIGIYGNGFKSGSMRLGKDALVFTKNGGAMTVGLLSQTYLEAIGAKAVIIPTVPFNQQTHEMIVTEDSVPSLEAILKHTLFNTKEEVLEEFNAIPNKKGTRIIVWNLRRNKNETTELDFTMDKHDIRIPSIETEEDGRKDPWKLVKHDPFHTQNSIRLCSFRHYLSILYLKPRMQIVLRQKKVKAQLISKSLAQVERDIYKPRFAKPVRITFGFSCTKDSPYGILMYHKNRLVKPFQKVGCQAKPSSIGNGVGVIGVVECNFLKPAHNKQDFECSNEFRLTMVNLGLKLNEYWKNKKCKQKQIMQDSTCPDEVTSDVPDQTWVQCDDCLKWRKIPEGISQDSLPDKWHCSMNQDRQYRSCEIPEEPESSDEEYTPSYERKPRRQRHNKILDSERSLSPYWDAQQINQKMTLKVETKEEKSKKENKVKDGMESEDDTDSQKKEDKSTPVLESGSIKRRLNSKQNNCNKRKRQLDAEDTMYSEIHTSDNEEIVSQYLSFKNKNMDEDEDDYDDDVIIVEEKCVPPKEHIKVELQDDTTVIGQVPERLCSRTSSGGQSPKDMSVHVDSTLNQTDQDYTDKQILETGPAHILDTFDNSSLGDLYLLETAETCNEQQSESNMPELCSQTETIQTCNGMVKNTDNADILLKERVKELEKELTVMRQQLAVCQCNARSSIASVKLGLVEGGDGQNICLQYQQKSQDQDVFNQACKKTDCALKTVTEERDKLLQKVEEALKEQNQLQQEYEKAKEEVIYLQSQLSEKNEKMVIEPVLIKSELEILEAKNLVLEERLNEAIREMEVLKESTSTSVDKESPAARLKSLRINVAKLLASILSDIDQEEVIRDNSRIDELLQKVIDSMQS